ncbi:Helix-turn-helix [Izhakiella capsodis]|uniref:Helix-turn-helix n=1 Tax=Izhakiella capsodis TaxID=1367852 RepID=A0A1I4VZA2_9GAMM|nr:helix-turn-helix transcriptional regulator [Izhakiella capsodis]SFN06648.1 Helix-turn-helix [Izhakiella capsodis]
MKFSTRLTQLRRSAGLTQQGLADSVAIHVNQLRRYEAGIAKPTLSPLIKLARRLNVSLDDLVFANAEYDPPEELIKQFLAVKLLPIEERRLVIALIDTIITHAKAHTAKNKAGPSPDAHHD